MTALPARPVLLAARLPYRVAWEPLAPRAGWENAEFAQESSCALN